MTNRLALILGLVLAALLLYDNILNDHRGTVFVARKIMDLADTIAVWR